MADNNQNKNDKELDTLSNKSSLITYGLDDTLSKEAEQVRGLVKNVIANTKVKFGSRTTANPINYFNELNLGTVFNELLTDNKKSGEQPGPMDPNNLKEYMQKANIDIGGLLLEDGDRTMSFNNYRIIQRHIPECAQALKTYKDNIMSPDDFTKLIFNVVYDGKLSKKGEKIINQRLDDLTVKYKVEDMADSIIETALMLGEDYLAVLSLEDEFGNMLKDVSVGKTLNEQTIRLMDPENISATILSENVNATADEVSALNEALDTNLSTAEANTLIATFVNENVQIGSSRELLIERAEAENGMTGVDIPGAFSKASKGRKKKGEDDKPLYVNGSAVRRLQPERVIDLTIDNVCYGYYYAEEIGNRVPQSNYLGIATGRNAQASMSLATNNTVATTTGGVNSPSQGGAAEHLGVGENKLRLISDLFLNQISKKVDKDFIRKNRKFKDFLYELVKQDFIIRKGLKLTYFKPEEVIKFECRPVYKDIVFFAKLYISILSDNLLIKLGRSHDKRLFYVNVGADAQYEQAIQSVIQDIKTKDYKMENLNDFNTLLSLAPGRFDDYFMPTINGDKPIEIDTLQGMDTELDSEFLQYLRRCMMSGMGVPANLVDVSSEVDFARNISAMNANFVRSVIGYQKKFTLPFTKLYQTLYRNEYRYTNNGEALEEAERDIEIENIKASFPSPASLAMTNTSEQIQAADQNADFISQQYYPMDTTDAEAENKRLQFKTEVVRKLLPGIDWEQYDTLKDEFEKQYSQKKVEKPATGQPDQYGGY